MEKGGFRMGVTNKQFLLKTLKKHQLVSKKKFIKTQISFFKVKINSFILSKKNSSFFYKTEKLYLFITEIFVYFLSFFNSKNKSLFLSDEKIMFYLVKISFLRSFQNIFFGFYKNGFFKSDLEKCQIFLKTVDIFFLFSIKNHVIISKDINFSYKPLILLLEKNIPENFLFYKVFFGKGLFFSFFTFFKLLSDFLIKTQLYNYIIIKQQLSIRFKKIKI
jgi:hypothetical protein